VRAFELHDSSGLRLLTWKAGGLGDTSHERGGNLVQFVHGLRRADQSVTMKSGGQSLNSTISSQLSLNSPVLSFTADQVPVSVQNTQVNVGQVNIGQDNALDKLRRLAFAIEKAARAQEAGLLDSRAMRRTEGPKEWT
jgi:hypothetical protein